MTIPGSGIGKVIGPGGKSKRALMEEFGLTDINVEDLPNGDGRVMIAAFDSQRIKAAQAKVCGRGCMG